MLRLKNLTLAAVALIVALSSCITEKKRQKICNTCPIKTERHDSIVQRIDTVKVNIPGEPGPTVYLENPCKLLCDSLGRLKPVNIHTVKNGQILHINTQGNGINISSERKDTAVNATVVNTDRYSKRKDVEVRYEVCKRDHRTAFDGWCRYWFYGTAGALVIWVGWRRLRVMKIRRPGV